MDKITKLPWKWQDRYDYREHIEHRKQGLNSDCENIKDVRIRLVNSDGEVVLQEWAEYADDSGLQIKKEDAEYICRAVNSHEGLVEAVEIALRALEVEGISKGLNPHLNHAEHFLKQALKAADGEGVK